MSPYSDETSLTPTTERSTLKYGEQSSRRKSKEEPPTNQLEAQA